MAATNFKTENNTFRKLIGNGLTYRIPRFQRDYSWDTNEWEELWADILETIESDNSHYMGYLVLQSADDKKFDVIDGQQRLTTISLIVLAVLKNIQRLIDAEQHAEDNKKRFDYIRQTYVGYVDIETLSARPKLTLNKNNNDYFQTYLVPLRPLPQRGFRASEHLLRKAFEWFDGQVEKMAKEQRENSGARLGRFIEQISDRLFFTIITVSDELNAYKVFETLNARGVRLSATDLLKNYLFSILDGGKTTGDYDLREMEERWENIGQRLQAEKIPEFLRIHWNSRRKFSRHSVLFKNIRAVVNTREHVFTLLRDMEDDIDIFLALTSPENSGWTDEEKKMVAVLQTFRVRQPFPLLVAARHKLSAHDFTGLLRAVLVISFRYNVIGTSSPNVQEHVYNSVAQRISQGDLKNLTAILAVMQEIYVSDKTFKAAFADKIIRTTDARNNRVTRYILCMLEKHSANVEYEFFNAKFNVEHVLPQNAHDGWGEFSNQEAQNLLYRLGNMTLLSAKSNSAVGNEAFHVKREIYKDSEFKITRDIALEHAQWRPENIAARQNWMAEQATSIWRIAQYDKLKT